jgi:hypothetical protein
VDDAVKNRSATRKRVGSVTGGCGGFAITLHTIHDIRIAHLQVLTDEVGSDLAALAHEGYRERRADLAAGLAPAVSVGCLHPIE